MDIITALSNGLIATVATIIVTTIQQRRQAKKNFKMQIFKDLISYRTDMITNTIPTGNLEKALNLVFVAYNDSPKVLEAFERFRKGIEPRINIIDNFVSLLKAMAKELHINYDFSNDDLFTTPIKIKPTHT